LSRERKLNTASEVNLDRADKKVVNGKTAPKELKIKIFRRRSSDLTQNKKWGELAEIGFGIIRIFF